MKKPLFKQRKKQLSFLSKKLAKLMKANDEAGKELVTRLIQQIRRLLHEMRFSISKIEAKKMLGAAAIIFGISFTTNTNAQSFGSAQMNPFNLQPAGTYINIPATADIDNDGDNDMLTVDDYGAYFYYENIGDSANANFAAPVNAFNLPSTGYAAFPTFVDLDADGDFDLVVGSMDYYTYNTVLMYYENVGNATTPQFIAPINNAFGMVPPAYGSIPSFADLDNDGDMDLLTGQNYGDLQYFENTGSTTNPQFAAPLTNPFGLSAGMFVSAPDFADVDEDGDMDLLVGQLDTVGNNTLLYFENSGDATTPQFNTPVINPFGINGPMIIGYPHFADMDADADMDLFSLNIFGGLSYYENTSTISLKESSPAFEFELYPNPAKDVLQINTYEVIKGLQVLDLSGRSLISSSSNSLDVSNLAAGSYLLKVTNNNGEEVIKNFTKQ